jgi:TonB family protein
VLPTSPAAVRFAGRLIAARCMVVIFVMICAACVPGSQAQDARKAISKVNPVYPEIAKSMGLKGMVKLQIIVAPDGTVKDVTVIGGHPVLVNAAVEAVKKWKYAPAVSESTISVQFDFSRISN